MEKKITKRVSFLTEAQRLGTIFLFSFPVKNQLHGHIWLHKKLKTCFYSGKLNVEIKYEGLLHIYVRIEVRSEKMVLSGLQLVEYQDAEPWIWRTDYKVNAKFLTMESREMPLYAVLFKGQLNGQIASDNFLLRDMLSINSILWILAICWALSQALHRQAS